MTLPVIPIKRLDVNAVIPSQAKASDAGYDLHTVERFHLEAGERRLVKTGIAVAIPEGYVGYIKPRSGHAYKRGIDVLGGVIDSGYRGEIGVILLNTDREEEVAFQIGERIAQLVIQPVASVDFTPVFELPESERAATGFGSSGR